MLSGLHFETAGAGLRPAPERADVACFVGWVARRPRSPLPAPLRTQLERAGWIGGPWGIPEERVDGLLDLPVALDDWETFAELFAWEERALRAGSTARCTSYLGAAVRSFFGRGGRRAVIVRVGDPWPYLGGEPRTAARAARLSRLVPGSAGALRPFAAADPRGWQGLEHVYGLGEVSHVCLPDLADACATDPQEVPVASERPAAPEVFVECSAGEPAPSEDQGLRSVRAPRLAPDGYAAWARVMDRVRTFLGDHRRDTLLVAALPLPDREARSEALQGGAWAQSDMNAFLEQFGVLAHPRLGVDPGQAPPGAAASAFVQLVWPWLETSRSTDLPERLEPGDGLLCGLLATNALARGTFRSVAGRALADVSRREPEPDLGLGPDSPAAQLAERVCLIGPTPDGTRLLSDVTSSDDPAWRSGGVSRLMSALLRSARRAGEAELFDANGPELWARIRSALEGVLEGYFRAGGLGGGSLAEAYQVRCDRSTTTQNDLDHGRVRAEVTVLPAASIARLTISLELAAGGAELGLPEVA